MEGRLINFGYISLYSAVLGPRVRKKHQNKNKNLLFRDRPLTAYHLHNLHITNNSKLSIAIHELKKKIIAHSV